MADGSICKDLVYGQLTTGSRSQDTPTFASRMSVRVIRSSLIWTQKGGNDWPKTAASGGMRSADRLPEARPGSEELLQKNGIVENIVRGLHSEAPPESAVAVEKTVTSTSDFIAPSTDARLAPDVQLQDLLGASPH